jgi:hypothetical protein
MPHQPLLLDTLRLAEMMAKEIDRRMTGLSAGEHVVLATKIRDIAAFFMLHLVRGFPAAGMPHPRQSLETAKGYLATLHGHILELPREAQELESGMILTEACIQVLNKLEQTLAMMGADPPTSMTRRYFPTPTPERTPSI